MENEEDRVSKNLHIYVAMSGGVDSSVAAALLVEQGYLVSGIMMKLWDADQDHAGRSDLETEDVLQARNVAKFLKIPFQVVDFRDQFRREVVGYYLQSLANGLTPNPCFVCNQRVKWGVLLREVLSEGGDKLASGHYARVKTGHDSKVRLYKARDAVKDQSYVLAGLTQEQLTNIVLPLGNLTKQEVREIAHSFGFRDKVIQESQDLCFHTGLSQSEFLSKYQPQLMKPGDICTVEGEKLGTHTGLANYTIGQRKGVSQGGGIPYFVISKDILKNTLMVGRKEQLGFRRVTINQVNWISGELPQLPITCDIKIRYKATPAKGAISRSGNDEYDIIFDIPIRDATPGQYAVFYLADEVIGSGVITRAASAEEK